MYSLKGMSEKKEKTETYCVKCLYQGTDKTSNKTDPMKQKEGNDGGEITKIENKCEL